MAISDGVKVTVARGAWAAVGPKLGMVETEIDISEVNDDLVAAGDGVLASGDVVEVFSLPQGTCVLWAGVEITETVAGTTQLTTSLGYGGDVDKFVTAVDIGSSTSYVATDYLVSNLTDGLGPWLVGDGAAGATSDTLDLVFSAVTGTNTAGKLRVWAIVADIADMSG